MAKSANLGFPRIGAFRELKKAVELFWKGEIDEAELQAQAIEIRKANWQTQKVAGLDIIPSNDFDKVKNSLADYGVKCSEPKDSSLVSTQKCQCPDYNSLPDIQMTLMDKDTNNMKAFSLPKESYMEKAGGNGCNNAKK